MASRRGRDRAPEGGSRADLTLAALVDQPAEPPEALSVVEAVDLVIERCRTATATAAAKRLPRVPNARAAVLAVVNATAPLLSGGAATVARLLVEPAREVPTGEACWIATTCGHHGTVTVTSLVLRPAEQWYAVDSVDEHEWPAQEASLIRMIAGVAQATSFTPADGPVAQFVVGPGADVIASEVVAAAAVLGCRLLPLRLDNADDATAVQEAVRRLRDKDAGPVVAYTTGDEWSSRRLAKARRDGRRVIDLSDVVADALPRAIADALSTSAAGAPASPAPADDVRQIEVTLAKEGNRGAHDYLVLTERKCQHGATLNARGADKKWKGAQRVAGLPTDAHLLSMRMCATPGCNLAWAVYRTRDSTWPAAPA